MPEPKFHYQPMNEEGTRFKVYTDAPGDADGFLYQGIVYETADRSWVADWTGRSVESIAMPGFTSSEYAASALYWFTPPTQSFGSRLAGKKAGTMDERVIDTSQCGCCVNNGCECEGTNRISERFGTTQSYEVQPSLIPAPGVLVSLMPLKDGDFLVDFNTQGCGSGIGYLQKRDDGRYDVRMGHKSIGIAPKPETGMWACLQAHTGTKFYSMLIEGFEPHEHPIHTVPEDK
ncbi:hypothetical protein [Streptomyces halobius]|uniref:Uncharacterized protein n=1 Tax=Streptomyces halobius TaxID=2879846 RepID=A0ABY4M0R5_9ACTN|nr:hypothetical protein [Streptomyces halobius]UQA91355.1 hypothetical protein K9S39_05210 [Streptomyces halobius]